MEVFCNAFNTVFLFLVVAVKSYYGYEYTAGCIRVALKIRREYIHVAFLKTTRTQPTLMANSGLLINMNFF